jgi:mono/diheme cytochrome c family protein
MKPKASSLRRRSMAHVVALGVAGLIVAGVAAGCGSSGDKTAVTPATTTSSTPTTTAGGAQVADGAQLFSSNCESCHGSMGAGGHVGPNLQKSPVAEHLADVEKQVRHGGGAMPPFSGVLSDQEIDAVAHYVVEQIAPKG